MERWLDSIVEFEPVGFGIFFLAAACLLTLSFSRSKKRASCFTYSIISISTCALCFLYIAFYKTFLFQTAIILIIYAGAPLLCVISLIILVRKIDGRLIFRIICLIAITMGVYLFWIVILIDRPFREQAAMEMKLDYEHERFWDCGNVFNDLAFANDEYRKSHGGYIDDVDKLGRIYSAYCKKHPESNCEVIDIGKTIEKSCDKFRIGVNKDGSDYYISAYTKTANPCFICETPRGMNRDKPQQCGMKKFEDKCP